MLCECFVSTGAVSAIICDAAYCRTTGAVLPLWKIQTNTHLETVWRRCLRPFDSLGLVFVPITSKITYIKTCDKTTYPWAAATPPCTGHLLMSWRLCTEWKLAVPHVVGHCRYFFNRLFLKALKTGVVELFKTIPRVNQLQILQRKHQTWRQRPCTVLSRD